MENEIEVGSHAFVQSKGERVLGKVLGIPGHRFPNGRVAERYEVLQLGSEMLYLRDVDEVALATDDDVKEADENYARCDECKDWLDIENGEHTYDKNENIVCHACESSEFENASTVHVVHPDGEKKQVLVTERFTVEREYFEPVTGYTREWQSSSGYRGTYVTSVEGHVEVLSGWMTGWVDETVPQKARFNEWLERVLGDDEEHEPAPCKFVIAFDPTSNVFSTAVGVWVEEENRDEFVEWLGDDFEVLHNALT